MEYCTGISPTEGSPTFPDGISPVEYCEDIELALGSTFSCRSCSSVSASADLSEDTYVAGDYVEVEFSGYIDFKQLPNPIKEVRWVDGNVWQIFLSDWYTGFDQNKIEFNLELAFIGSISMRPSINWARMCKQEALQHIDDSIFISNVPDNCIVLQDDRWDHTRRGWMRNGNENEVQLQLILSDDRDSSYYLGDYNYIDLHYFPTPEASTVSEIVSDSSIMSSVTLDGNIVSIDFDTSQTGESL